MASHKSKQHLSDYRDHFEEYMRVNHPKILEHIIKTFNPSIKQNKDTVQKHKKGDPTPSVAIETASTSTNKDIASSTNNKEDNQSNKDKITRNDDSAHKSKEDVKKAFKGDSGLTVSVQKNIDEVQTVRNEIKSNKHSFNLDEEVEPKRPKLTYNYNSTRRFNDQERKDLSPKMRELEKNDCEMKKELANKTKYDKQDNGDVQLIDKNQEKSTSSSDTNRMKNNIINHEPQYHSSQRCKDDLRNGSSPKFDSSPEPGEIDDYQTKTRHENRRTYRLHEIVSDKLPRKSPAKFNGKNDYNYYSSDQASRGTTSFERHRDTEKSFWIHVGRCELSTTEKDVKQMLKEKFPLYHFECEKQKIKEGDFNARFRVRVPRELQSEIYSPEHWPEGILVTPFMNFRPPGTFKRI